MKRKVFSLILLAFLSVASVLQAQAPQSVTLQSVLRDAAGRLVANRNVGVRITLTRTSASGPVIYQETHTPTTNQNGLYTVFFGQGTATSGTFAGIDWAQGPYYAKVEADPNGGNNYSLTVNHPIVSVPYALYAEQANEQQALSLSNDTIYLTGGGATRSFVKLPALGGGGAGGCVPSCGKVDTIKHKLDSLINISCVATIAIITMSECDSYNWPLTQQTYYTSGSYTKVLQRGNAKGCDSIVILSLTIKPSTHNVESKEVTGFYTWYGTNYTTSGTKVHPYNNALGCASADTLKLKVNTLGLMKGEFTVNNSGKKIRFSQGNLQYKASINQWRFAERQYDYIGEGNGNVFKTATDMTRCNNESLSSTYDGWIDLFGWGTSNFKTDNYHTRFKPWNSETNDVGNNCDCNTYGYGPSKNMTIKDLSLTTKSDWGANNIANGGNQAGIWRTLTYNEWNYLFKTRATQSTNLPNYTNARYCHATVNGVKGMILFPDVYIHPAGGIELQHINTTGTYATNAIDKAAWDEMEAAGAIFLPAAGERSGGDAYEANDRGKYWTATYYDKTNARYFYFYDSYFYYDGDYYHDRFLGHSVRLVQDVE